MGKEILSQHPPLEGWKKVILFLPIVMGMSWVLFLRFQSSITPQITGEIFAPGSTQPLFMALSLFIIGYVLFLFIMFSDDITDYLHKDKK